jgi:hypothetical protein
MTASPRSWQRPSSARPHAPAAASAEAAARPATLDRPATGFAGARAALSTVASDAADAGAEAGAHRTGRPRIPCRPGPPRRALKQPHGEPRIAGAATGSSGCRSRSGLSTLVYERLWVRAPAFRSALGCRPRHSEHLLRQGNGRTRVLQMWSCDRAAPSTSDSEPIGEATPIACRTLSPNLKPTDRQSRHARLRPGVHGANLASGRPAAEACR